MKAAATKTDLHCFKFSFGAYLFNIGSAFLNDASISLGSVIKLISTFVEKDKIITYRI